MSDNLLLNDGALIHVLREHYDDELYLKDEGIDTSIFEDWNPMGIRFFQHVSAWEEDGYGVNDLIVLKDNQNQFWGVTMYRGLGKHDDNNDLYELTDRVRHAFDPDYSDGDPLDYLDGSTTEMFPLARKATIAYEKVRK